MNQRIEEAKFKCKDSDDDPEGVGLHWSSLLLAFEQYVLNRSSTEPRIRIGPDSLLRMVITERNIASETKADAPAPFLIFK